MSSVTVSSREASAEWFAAISRSHSATLRIGMSFKGAFKPVTREQTGRALEILEKTQSETRSGGAIPHRMPHRSRRCGESASGMKRGQSGENQPPRFTRFLEHS